MDQSARSLVFLDFKARKGEGGKFWLLLSRMCVGVLCAERELTGRMSISRERE
jgi:hypothetical protein